MKTIGLRVENEDLEKRIESACVEAIGKWGQPKQLDMAVEELLELVNAILHFKRGFTKDRFCNLQEEIVDVLIMIKQLGIMADLDGLDYWFDKKVSRLEKRLED